MRGKIRMGMIGGGRGAFIGAVHRMAAALDGQIDLVAGAFSSSPEISQQTGQDLFLDPQRVYDDYTQMIKAESQRSPDDRIQLISIVTPNHLHYDPAMKALDHGFHVICDKPLCFDLEQAYALQRKVEETGLLFAVTYTYTGYPMIKQARHMASLGKLGEIRKIVVSFPQGWLSARLEDTGQKQAEWRMDPERSGIAGSVGDIGTHAANLLEYVTGARITELCADVNTMVEGRMLDDDAGIFVKLSNGARGVILVSQVATGEENGFSLKVYGNRAGIAWSQQDCNSLRVLHPDRPMEILRTGGPGLSREAEAHTRLPAGHPEGYLEAFANIYRNVAHALRGSTDSDQGIHDFPDINEGVRGMEFIYKVIHSGTSETKWIKI